MLYNPNAMLWLQMGLGKTIIALTVIVDLMRAGKVKKTVIFGPIRVIESVWGTQIKEWSHTNHLRISILRGTEKKRKQALFRDVDIYLINYELMNWFSQIVMHYYISQNKELPFQCVIYDEISKLKNSQSLRMKGGKRDVKDKNGNFHVVKILGFKNLINYFQFRYGLTGTPASNGYIDLHGQFLAVDNGERLGKYITHYRESYFTQNFNGWGYKINNNSKKLIENKISDITKKMDAKDYLDLPSVKIINIFVELPVKIRKAYKELENQMFTEINENTQIEIFNSASLSNKCLQFCNGACYINTETRKWEKLHDEKLKVLESVLEEAGGSPVICSYSFKSDAERIMTFFKKYNPINLTQEKTKNTQKIINEFNEGKIKLLIGHPASMGHGIDGLQKNGSILVWFGLNWSLELYEQMNGRINRQGQTKSVTIIHIVCKNSVDIAVLDAIKRKNTDQKQLKKSLQNYQNNPKEISFI